MSAKAILALRGSNGDNEFSRDYANEYDGQGAVITYSFLTSAPEDASSRDQSTFSTYSSQEKAMVYAALRYISTVANVKFVETSLADARLTFGQSDLPGNVAGTATPVFYSKILGRWEPGQVWLDRALDYRPNSHTIHYVLHEFGHALGLQHPFEGSHRLSGKELASSAMGYTYSGPSNRLGVYDIMALQEIYGAPTVRTGKNTYKLGADKLIFDAGGVDTLDASGASAKVGINLDPGAWNYINKKAGSVLSAGQAIIGKATIIENATGSKFNDTIHGNSVANLLKGGAGNDKLYGRDGNDKLYGEAGNDTLDGGNGSDYLSGGSGNDKLYGREGDDRLYGATGNDSLDGSNGNDALYGDAGNDKLYGGAGDDKLYGGSGNDLLSGGSGMDYLSGSSGNDTIWGGAGADRLYGGSGKDVFKFNSYAELGDLSAFDIIFDFRKEDKIDFRSFDANPEVGGRQKLTFLGNSTSDAKLNAYKAGQFYYNTVADALVLDANGDGLADFYIGVRGVDTMKSSYFLI